MNFVIEGEDGVPLDATVTLEAGAITLHSRGGTLRAPNVRNTEYGAALRLLLARLLKHGRNIHGAWVDSTRVQHLDAALRQVLYPSDLPTDAASLFTLVGRRMERVGKAPGADPEKGNRNRRLRFHVGTSSVGEISSVIQARPLSDVPRSALRLPAGDLRRVGSEHILRAVNDLLDGKATAPFDTSLEYDLITPDGDRLPPKAVFGLAASDALGFAVRPVNFTAGIGTPCFELLEGAGWQIVAKASCTPVKEMLLNDADQEWAEGDPARAWHLRRERHRGVVRAKKAQMLKLHGNLHCERCGLDPVQAFGVPEADACIEVHHRSTQVAAMTAGHRTRLEDVECLCANCHRIVHRLMKRGLRRTSVLPRDRNRL